MDVEFIEESDSGVPDTWTKVLEADSGRRMRLDYTCGEFEDPGRFIWFHNLEGTRFEEHLTRQETTISLEEAGGDCLVTITSDGELRGSAKIASLALKGDQKKMLDQALDGLASVFQAEEEEA